MRNLRRCFGLVGFLVWVPLSSQGATLTLKSALEIPYFLSSITDVDFNESDIKSYYKKQASKFPRTGALDELTESYLVAATSYSSLFCDRMIRLDAQLPSKQRWAHQGLDFSKPVAQWTRGEIQTLLASYADRLWSRPLTTAEESLLTSEFDAVVKLLPNDATSVEILLNYFCPAFTASLTGLSK